MRLSRKVALLALTNLLLLAAVMAVFFRTQFQSGAESLLVGPVQDRALAIATRFSAELSGVPANGADALFAAYRQRYGADFFLTNPDGEALAGPPADPPPEVRERMRRPPARPGTPPPPPHKKKEERPPRDRKSTRLNASQ